MGTPTHCSPTGKTIDTFLLLQDCLVSCAYKTFLLLPLSGLTQSKAQYFLIAKSTIVTYTHKLNEPYLVYLIICCALKVGFVYEKSSRKRS